MNFDRCLAPIPPFVGPRTWVPPTGAHVRGRATATKRLLTTDPPAYHQHDLDKHNPDRHDLPQHNSGVRGDGEQDDGDQRQGERGGGMVKERASWEGLYTPSRQGPRRLVLARDESGTARVPASQGIARVCVKGSRVCAGTWSLSPLHSPRLCSYRRRERGCALGRRGSVARCGREGSRGGL
ncbi:hypothetical protein BD626DRAFT_177130 [Schizophyllum amplum]|uniref:Uncharacterized protein n=1 Tax=Schizophyllum amplum TaxID=97359 RepID=A0A550C294_9AGAR|nr:hypothetical protein BD626DRAFT_177130 [Auriculariopsis ampla]